jgi:hypothetical protein
MIIPDGRAEGPSTLVPASVVRRAGCRPPPAGHANRVRVTPHDYVQQAGVRAAPWVAPNLTGNAYPVPWACKQKTEPDGSLILRPNGRHLS